MGREHQRARHVLAELYQRQGAALTAYLHRLVGQRELAEDLCHEAFLRAWQRWSAEGPPQEARAWLYRVATNAAYDELRRRARRAERALAGIEPESLAAHDQMRQVEDRDQVARLLAALAPELAALLVDQYVHERPLHELARRLDTPVGTLKSRTSRARARLRLLLDHPDHAGTRLKEHPMTVEQHKALASRYVEEVLNAHRLAAIDELIGGGYVVHDPGTMGRRGGVDGAKETLRAYLRAFPDLRYAVEDMFAEGERVAVRWRATGTHRGELMGIPPTGKQGRIDGMSIFRFSDGKIVEQWISWDTMGLMLQLGVIPLIAERGQHPTW